MRTLKFLFLVIGLIAFTACGSNNSVGNVAVETNSSVSEVNQSDYQVIDGNSLKVFTTDGEELKLVFKFPESNVSTSSVSPTMLSKNMEVSTVDTAKSSVIAGGGGFYYQSSERDEYLKTVLQQYSRMEIIMYDDDVAVSYITVDNGDKVSIPKVIGEYLNFQIYFYNKKGEKLLSASVSSHLRGELFAYIYNYFELPILLDVSDTSTVSSVMAKIGYSSIYTSFEYQNDGVIKLKPDFSYNPYELKLVVHSFDNELYYVNSVGFKGMLAYLRGQPISLGNTEEFELGYEPLLNPEYRLLQGELISIGSEYSSNFVSSYDYILFFGAKSIVENYLKLEESYVCDMYDKFWYEFELPDINITINSKTKTYNAESVIFIKEEDNVSISFSNSSEVETLFKISYIYDNECKEIFEQAMFDRLLEDLFDEDTSEEILEETTDEDDDLGELLEEAPSENP